MSLINKMAKYGATPLNGGGGAAVLGQRLIGPPGRIGPGGYMGDPGIFGDIWGGIKSVGKFATGVVSKLGIPVVSGTAGTLGQMFFGRDAIPGASTQPLLPPPVVMPPWPVAMPGSSYLTQAGAPQIGARGPGAFTVDPLAFLPGGRPLLSPAGAAYPAAVKAGGYHLNKSSYFLMDGTFIEKETRWVKNRRRNPGNMRALSRSLGRIKSAKRMTKALSAVTIRSTCPHSHGGKKKK